MALHLEDAIGRIETRITSEVAGTSLTYHWGDGSNDADHIAHKGVSVSPNGTTNTGAYRDQASRDGVSWVEDDIDIRFAYRLASGAQRAGRDASIALARSIRVALQDETWMRGTLGADLMWVNESYEPHPQSPGWVLVTLGYTMTRRGPIV